MTIGNVKNVKKLAFKAHEYNILSFAGPVTDRCNQEVQAPTWLSNVSAVNALFLLVAAPTAVTSHVMSWLAIITAKEWQWRNFSGQDVHDITTTSEWHKEKTSINPVLFHKETFKV